MFWKLYKTGREKGVCTFERLLRYRNASHAHRRREKSERGISEYPCCLAELNVYSNFQRLKKHVKPFSYV